MEPKSGLTVSPGHVAGFGTDVGDFTDRFWDLANKTLGSVALPSGAAGLLAGLDVSLGGFRDRISDAHQRDREGCYKLSGGLTEAGRAYHGQDQGNAQSLNIFGLGGAFGGELDHTAWGGAQYPETPGIGPADASTRQIVQWAIATLAPFEAGLESAAGVKPVADHLEPIDCDWGALQPLAAHVDLLGSNDQALASNLGGGAKWLAQHWSGTASQAFTAASNTRRNSADERGAHMTTVAAVLRKGGQQVEQQARNQALALVGDLMRPTTFEGFTLSLGLWGTIIDRQMSESVRAEIRGDLQAAHTAAASRHEDILGTMQAVQSALQAESAQAIPSVGDDGPSTRSITGQGRAGYGFGGYTWMEADRDFRPAA